VLAGVQALFVLIFNPGKSNEGVYTLQGKTSPASSYVLAFEQTDEAIRFADLLHAEGFDMPQPMEWRAETIRTFCERGEFEIGIVPRGALLTPPSHNEYGRPREGNFDRLRKSRDGSAGSASGPHNSRTIDMQRKRLDRLFDA